VAAAPRAPGPEPVVGDGRFGWGECFSAFAKGLTYAFTGLVDGFQADPIRSVLTLAGLGAAGAAIAFGLPLLLPAIGLGAVAPFVLPALSLGAAAWFGATGAAKIVRGATEALALHGRGEPDAAEQRFEAIGEGTFDVASAVVSAIQGLRGVRAALAARGAAATAGAVVRPPALGVVSSARRADP
jgi:hypothetical protein